MSNLLAAVLRSAAALATVGVGAGYGTRWLRTRLPRPTTATGSAVATQVVTWSVACALLLPLWWPAGRWLGSTSDNLVLVPLGAAVGVGELALCGLLSTMVASTVRGEPVGSHNWFAVVHSGAVLPYRQLAQRLARPGALGVFLLVGLVQEALLRGAVFSLARGGGAGLAVGVSVCCSLLAAVLPVRDRDGQYLAGVVGLVTGLVHGLLYAATHSLLPLAVAQGAFLALAVL
jgi:hypothetical protein